MKHRPRLPTKEYNRNFRQIATPAKSALALTLALNKFINKYIIPYGELFFYDWQITIIDALRAIVFIKDYHVVV